MTQQNKIKTCQWHTSFNVVIITVCALSVMWVEIHENSVGAGQGQDVTGTCLNNSPLLTHQCIGFCCFLTPFNIASFPRHPQGFAELPWIIWWVGEGRQANNNYHILTMGCESTGPKLAFFFSTGSWGISFSFSFFSLTQTHVSYKLGVRFSRCLSMIPVW